MRKLEEEREAERKEEVRGRRREWEDVRGCKMMHSEGVGGRRGKWELKRDKRKQNETLGEKTRKCEEDGGRQNEEVEGERRR